MKELPLNNITNQYKYLCVEMIDKVDTKCYIERIINYIDKVINIIRTGNLSARNLIRTINSDVIPKIRYGSCIVPWQIGQLRSIDAKIRSILTNK